MTSPSAGHALAGQPLHQRVVDRRRCHDQALDLARAQELDLGALASGSLSVLAFRPL